MAKNEPTNPAQTSTSDETITAPDAQAQQFQLQVDESKVQTFSSSTARVYGSAEEIVLDFSQGIRPSGRDNISVMRIDARVLLSPWAAKRLAIALGQAVQRYEQAYGALEIDPRKRMVQQPAADDEQAKK